MADEQKTNPDDADTVIVKPGNSFDKQVIELLQPALHEVFLKHGDYVRSIGVFVDYYGPFNDADGVNKGIWIGPQGAVNTPDGVIGSMGSCLRLLDTIIQRADAMHGMYREQLTVLINEMKQRSAEYGQGTEKAEGHEAAE